MIKFKLNGETEVNLPTNLKEVTNDYLLGVSESINIADDYCLIAVVSRATLANIAYSSNAKKSNGFTVGIIPIFVKAGKSDNDFINSINTGATIVISRTALEMGEHIKFNTNPLTYSNITNLLLSDSNLMKELIKNDYSNIEGGDKETLVCMIDFKLVPACDVHSYFKNVDKYENPFIKI